MEYKSVWHKSNGINNGFEWGGNFRSISDMPHFQMTFGYSISDLLNLYEFMTMVMKKLAYIIVLIVVGMVSF